MVADRQAIIGSEPRKSEKKIKGSRKIDKLRAVIQNQNYNKIPLSSRRVSLVTPSMTDHFNPSLADYNPSQDVETHFEPKTQADRNLLSVVVE